MDSSSLQQILELIKKDRTFSAWKQQHKQAFLSHFFSPLDPQGNLKSNWEIGFYNPESEKITVFLQKEKKFEPKPEDDVFKKDSMQVEELQIPKVKISYDKAFALFQENYPVLFPTESIGDGFVILQTFSEKTEWNFTFISKTLKFLNIKFDAQNGNIDSYQTVDLVDKK